MLSLESNIKFIKGVGEKRAKLFNKLGIFDVDALIHFYPRKYEDWTKTKSVKDISSGEIVSIRATMITPVKEHMVRRGMTLYKCRFTDGENIINVTIFNNKYLANSMRVFEDYVLFGKIEKNLTTASMSSPKIEKLSTGVRIHPIYSATGQLSSAAIAKIIKTALENLPETEETLSEDILKKYNLVSLDKAIRAIHFPADENEALNARKRLIFEELLTLQLGLFKLKSNKKKETSLSLKKDYTKEFLDLLPFTLTNAQNRTIKECIDDMMKKHPMNRLLQGDVGSGKTAVAAGIIYTVIKNGYQTALMAPTEILASQHYDGLSKLLNSVGIRVELLTGSTKLKEKREIKSRLINGKIDLLIGTHAIIQNDVEFENLALVITDEQHRFGVKQRAALADKGKELHTLVMSATPIPRTLGLIIYGDLDISILDELPPGRQEIRTDVVDSRYHQRIYKFMKEAVARNEQCYVICPMVEENEEDFINVKSAAQYAEELSEGAFKGYNIGLLHGKMKQKEKENVMNAFYSGNVQILVATTVVEVGVDVPSATTMVVENAERFGLSQLHQLRGRIGRGSKKSYCVLVSDSKSEISRNRLMIMKKYSDGFKIADEDLKARGPGDFFGERQHGLPQLKIADMLEDIDSLHMAQECAEKILAHDYNLDLPENKALCNQINKMFQQLEY
ncbi:MAG: ATP-dependent DNA helicase RecG [Acetobacter sp.]|nr:ATP-dependent DNA helicase RecG [Bacteroides sp.]MCM1342071.1 ATP-dependent DNA helicase RecG [Acetobacter sp.]MCM1432739.1 ATP-dependent DNA helicase RecG [Clostridiales bacterium]